MLKASVPLLVFVASWMILRLEAMLNYLQKLGVVEVMEVSARVTHITHAFAK
jgi:hypothetical protein